MKKIILAFAVLGLGATAAMAEDTSPAPAEKEKLICKSEKITGSRTRVSKICLTKTQWDELAAKTKKDIDNQQRGAAGGTNSSFDPSKAPGAI